MLRHHKSAALDGNAIAAICKHDESLTEAASRSVTYQIYYSEETMRPHGDSLCVAFADIR